MDISSFISLRIPTGLVLSAVLGSILIYCMHRQICRSRSFYGPKSYPIAGSLFSFFRNRSRLPEWYTDMLTKSPTQTITVERLGGIKTVVTANPLNVEHILRTRFENYPKGEPFTAILHDLLGNGIFNADGEAWRLQRKTASHEFSTRSLRTFIVEAVESEVRDRLIPLLQNANKQKSRLDMQDILKRLAFDNICQVAFGMDPGCLDPSLPVSELAQAFDIASELSSKRSTAPFFFVWRAKRMLNIGSEKRLSEAIRVVHGFATDVIRRRRKEIGCTVDASHPKRDLLSRFITLTASQDLSIHQHRGSSEQFLRDIVISFILAGRDTTSAALTWFFWLISSHPRVEEAIHREVVQVLAAREAKRDRNLCGQTRQNYHHERPPAVELADSRVHKEKPERPRDQDQIITFSCEELQKMHYLHASLCESMRLYPPVPADSKHALRDDVLPDGTFVSRGTRVTYHPYAMGRMETIWGSDCLEFNPDRWLTPDGCFVPQSPFKFPVFQGGMRVCLGREMAFIQMKYIAASVIRDFRLLPLDSQLKPKFVPSLTARMNGGLPVVVQKRSKPEQENATIMAVSSP